MPIVLDYSSGNWGQPIGASLDRFGNLLAQARIARSEQQARQAEILQKAVLGGFQSAFDRAGDLYGRERLLGQQQDFAREQAQQEYDWRGGQAIAERDWRSNEAQLERDWRTGLAAEEAQRFRDTAFINKWGVDEKTFNAAAERAGKDPFTFGGDLQAEAAKRKEAGKWYQWANGNGIPLTWAEASKIYRDTGRSPEIVYGAARASNMSPSALIRKLADGTHELVETPALGREMAALDAQERQILQYGNLPLGARIPIAQQLQQARALAMSRGFTLRRKPVPDPTVFNPGPGLQPVLIDGAGKITQLKAVEGPGFQVPQTPADVMNAYGQMTVPSPRTGAQIGIDKNGKVYQAEPPPPIPAWQDPKFIQDTYDQTYKQLMDEWKTSASPGESPNQQTKPTLEEVRRLTDDKLNYVRAHSQSSPRPNTSPMAFTQITDPNERRLLELTQILNETGSLTEEQRQEVRALYGTIPQERVDELVKVWAGQ